MHICICIPYTVFIMPIFLFIQVIPLSQCSGIVEWCEGTIPIAEYLVGTASDPTTGAHARYRPKDWTSMACRNKFAVSSCCM